MDLEQFKFPITQREVAVSNGQNDILDLENPGTFLSGDYKAIVREDTNELISIVRKSYKIIPNQILIDNLLDDLSKLDTPFYVDESHSFVSNERMRLQVTFPEITMRDEDSDIALSLFLHNSYDLSEGVRMFWGAIRHVCTNGMVFGKVLSKFYHRHTKGFQLKNIQQALSRTYDNIPFIQQRIHHLSQMPVTQDTLQDIERKLGKRMHQAVQIHTSESQWYLYNAITYLISHAIDQRQRARYQQACANVFNL